ncbi:MAG: hypothetical protein ACI9TH_000805, partial [Kiritimatiellia bacterium]
ADIIMLSASEDGWREVRSGQSDLDALRRRSLTGIFEG